MSCLTWRITWRNVTRWITWRDETWHDVTWQVTGCSDPPRLPRWWWRQRTDVGPGGDESRGTRRHCLLPRQSQIYSSARLSQTSTTAEGTLLLEAKQKSRSSVEIWIFPSSTFRQKWTWKFWLFRKISSSWSMQYYNSQYARIITPFKRTNLYFVATNRSKITRVRGPHYVAHSTVTHPHLEELKCVHIPHQHLGSRDTTQPIKRQNENRKTAVLKLLLNNQLIIDGQIRYMWDLSNE